MRRRIKSSLSLFHFKKAQTTPTISFSVILIVFFFIIAISAVVSSLFFNSINDMIQLDDDFNNETKTTMQEYSVSMPLWIDNAFLLAVGLFFILGIVSAYFADSNPVFLIVDLLLLGVVLFLGMVFSNAYDDTITTDDYVSFANDYPKAHFILDNLLLVATIIIGSVFTTIYFKNRLLT